MINTTLAFCAVAQYNTKYSVETMSCYTHTGIHKMFKNIIKWFTPSSQSQLEQFIISKRPTNAAEVEFWTREYESKNTFVWGRGM